MKGRAINDQAFLELIEKLGPSEEGRPDDVVEIIRLFFRQASRLLEEIQRALDQGDGKAVMLAAHTMKSSSANLGAIGLASLCKFLELTGKRGDIAGAASRVPTLLTEYDRVREELQERIGLRLSTLDLPPLVILEAEAGSVQ